LLDDPARYRGRTVVLVVSGGNIEPRLLASVVLRGLGRQGRLVRFLVDAEDSPGRLAALATVIGEAGANIVEVEHGRLTSDIAVRRARVSFVVETLDARHADLVAAALVSAGFAVERRGL
jgi:threonine dehydratase